MSWKLAELKWRQELGLYESRWERQSGALPVERRQAIEAFEMLRQVSPCRTRALSVPQQRTLSPEQHLAGLGMQSPSLASPSSAINPGFQPVPTSQKVPVDIACLSSPRTPLERPLNRDERLVREAAAVSSKSQSSSSSGYKLPPPFRQASFAYGTSSQQVNQSQDPSSSSASIGFQTPQQVVAHEELTRLLDHLDTSPALSAAVTDLRSRSPLHGFSWAASRHETDASHHSSCCHPTENLDPKDTFGFEAASLLSPQHTPPADLLVLQGATFELLDNPLPVDTADISTAPDSSQTHCLTTISRHNSTSILLPKPSMSDKTVVENADRERSQRGDDEGDRDVASPSGIEGQSSGRRHFTPIYENFDQAYTSITGGDPSSQFGTPTPGTESLNNVYASGAASVLPSAADQTAHVASGSVSLPFQRSISPDDDEHMMVGRHAQLEGDRGDNPAGMQLASTDVALQPIMRNVRRGIATPISPLQREASSVMFDCDDRGIRDRSSSMPVRAPTPYPDLESGPHSGNESTIGNIVERYGGSDDSLLPTVGSERSRPGYSSSSGDTAPADATGVGRVYTQPRVRHNTALVGAPPSWPLPSEVSGSSETMGRNVTQLSSSPPTYGTTAGLLNISRQRTSAHGESPLDPINPFGPPPRSSSVYSSDLDEMLARRGRSTTPFDQIGEPGPAIASSPRPTSPAIQLLPQPLANDFDIPSRSNQTEARASIDEPSSSSGIGIALTGSEDPIVRFEQGDRTSTAFEEAIDTNDADDDAAWSTTQEGTNTQRNSAVPYVDLANATSSSSLGRQVVSAWDPLALRNEDEGTYRENAELVHLRRHNTLGEVQTIIPESSAEIASPRQRRQTGPRTSTSLALSGSEQTITPTLHNIGQNSGTLYQPTIPGNTLLLRTPRIISHPSETIVDMSATSSREDHAANNRALRMAELEDLIRRYEPRADDAPPRQQWPEARLTTDRRILEAENNEEFVRRQRGLTRTLLFLSIPFYIFTFPFVNSLATNGPVARNVLLWFSLRGGGPINNVHREDMALAERVELLLLGAVGVAMAAIFGGLVALLCGAW